MNCANSFRVGRSNSSSAMKDGISSGEHIFGAFNIQLYPEIAPPSLSLRREVPCYTMFHFTATADIAPQTAVNKHCRCVSIWQYTALYLTFRHRASHIQDRRFVTNQRTLFIYLIKKYISLSDICLRPCIIYINNIDNQLDATRTGY